MTVLKVASVVPVADMDRAIEVWQMLLGAAPTFRDGGAWAQFESNGARVALAGSDRTSDKAGLMLKVDNLDAIWSATHEAGWQCEAIGIGPHERRFLATTEEGVHITFYASLK